MDLFQELAQVAAGSKFEQIVGGVVIQMTEAIRGTATVEVGNGTWESAVRVFLGTLDTYQNSFNPSI